MKRRNTSTSPRTNILITKEIIESFLFCMHLGSFTLPLPLHKANWVKLNGKTLQVLKNSLVYSPNLLLCVRHVSGARLRAAHTALRSWLRRARCLKSDRLNILGLLYKRTRAVVDMLAPIGLPASCNQLACYPCFFIALYTILYWHDSSASRSPHLWFYHWLWSQLSTLSKKECKRSPNVTLRHIKLVTERLLSLVGLFFFWKCLSVYD